jgi:hypothetical protein
VAMRAHARRSIVEAMIAIEMTNELLSLSIRHRPNAARRGLSQGRQCRKAAGFVPQAHGFLMTPSRPTKPRLLTFQSVIRNEDTPTCMQGRSYR